MISSIYQDLFGHVINTSDTILVIYNRYMKNIISTIKHYQMNKLPAELIYYISSFLSIDDLISLSQTCKVTNEICKYRWKNIFKFVYPIIPLTDNENYMELFRRYYNVFSVTYEPIIKAIIANYEDIIISLYNIGADTIYYYKIHPIQSNLKSDVIVLPFVDSPYYFNDISLLSEFLMLIANELPDIKSGKIFPTGLYIKYCLKNGDIAKLYNKFDKGILLKWLILPIRDIDISKDIVVPSSKLAKLLIRSADEIIEYLGDVIFYRYNSVFTEIFKPDDSSLIKLYTHQLNITAIYEIKDRINYSQIDDEFTRDVLEILDNLEEYTVDYHDPEIDLICRNIASTYDYNYIRSIVYNLFYKYPRHIYRAAVFSLLRKEDKYSLLPIKLDIAEDIYHYLTGDIDLLDITEPELLKLVLTIQHRIEEINQYETVDYLSKLFGSKIQSNLINQAYHNNIWKIISVIVDVIKLYGIPIDFTNISDDILNKLDFITSLAMMNNFHNILNYVNICVDRDIDNEIVRNIISRPECYGMLIDKWPKSKKYMDMVEFSSDIKRYKAARRSANIYLNINLPDKIDGLVYLLSRLIPKDEVDRFLVRIFRNKFTKYFPNYKLNINYLMFDFIAIEHLINSYYSFGDTHKIIKDNIDIYPLSCEHLIYELLRYSIHIQDTAKILYNYLKHLGNNAIFILYKYVSYHNIFTKDEINNIFGHNIKLNKKPIIYLFNLLTKNLLSVEFAQAKPNIKYGLIHYNS